jgi:dual specificity MAP kinase phosphatase
MFAVNKMTYSSFSGNRSAAVVIAYLMKAKGWRLAQSFQWVKERRPQINLSSGN